MRRPGELAELDPVLPDEVLALTERMRSARDRAGLSSTEVRRRAGNAAPQDVTSTSQVSHIFTPTTRMTSLQPWARYRAVVDALGDSSSEVEPLWTAAHSAFEAWRAIGRGRVDDPPSDGPAPPARGRARWSRPALVSVVLALAVVTLTAALVVVLVGGGADVERSRLDNSDPVASGCSDPRSDQVYFSSLFEDWPVRQLRTAARIELHYSVECRTAWAVLLDAPPGSTATLVRLSDGRRLACISGADGRCSTQQLDNADVLVHATGQTASSFGQTRDA